MNVEHHSQLWVRCSHMPWCAAQTEAHPTKITVYYIYVRDESVKFL